MSSEANRIESGRTSDGSIRIDYLISSRWMRLAEGGPDRLRQLRHEVRCSVRDSRECADRLFRDIVESASRRNRYTSPLARCESDEYREFITAILEQAQRDPAEMMKLHRDTEIRITPRSIMLEVEGGIP